jgi:glucokinase
LKVPTGIETYYIGVDLGATWTKMGLSDQHGELIARETIETESKKGPEHVVVAITRTVDSLVRHSGISRSSLRGVGIGSPGPLDTIRGTIIDTPNLGWKDVPLRDMVADAVHLETAIDNDANAAALGQWWKGAGAGASSLVCLTLGTGVGGGIVSNGEIWYGSTGVAGEIGHMTIVVGGRRCNCGNDGCLEAYASATAIASRAIDGIEKGRHSSLKEDFGNDLRAITSEKVYRLSVDGDPFCREIMKETARYLAVGVTNVIHIFNPEVVVIAGGVVGAGEVLFGPLLEGVRERAFPVALNGVRIVPAALGGDAGLTGAVGLIKKKMDGSIVA